ncbi:helix-turn-helix transcriptional regulator [Methanolobus profundi]|uniref:DUF7343 domain-containing protein n=1 Tax=Methanolobus profundi TaxID=487685 RepID=A0A1I4PYW4_9EURY|nr:MarR family transcriptional regulator [Methanolobus profundi]SFM32593.1 hypothetical protein SAMN04488696_0973 [Methanolobus profundi]
MERTKIIVATGIIIIAGIIAVSILLQEAPVVIQIEGESFKIIEIPYSYTTGEAYMLLICGLFSGMALYQILISLNIHPFAGVDTGSIDNRGSDVKNDNEELLSPPTLSREQVILMALEGDEKRTVRTIVDNGGQMLQNELVNRLDFSKAKTSRIISNLERKGIISKQKYGLTNCISLTEKIRGENR